MPAADVPLSSCQSEWAEFFGASFKLGKEVGVQMVVDYVQLEDSNPPVILTACGMGQICCSMDAVSVTVTCCLNLVLMVVLTYLTCHPALWLCLPLPECPWSYCHV